MSVGWGHLSALKEKGVFRGVGGMHQPIGLLRRGVGPRERNTPLIKEYLGFLKGLLEGIYKGSLRELRNMA